MCCHKKCITKCQNSTICGPVDAMAASASVMPSVEFKVTEADSAGDEIDEFEENDEVCLSFENSKITISTTSICLVPPKTGPTPPKF